MESLAYLPEQQQLSSRKRSLADVDSIHIIQQLPLHNNDNNENGDYEQKYTSGHNTTVLEEESNEEMKKRHKKHFIMNKTSHSSGNNSTATVRAEQLKRLLSRHEEKVLKLFPYSKSGTGKDDYSYFRVKPALMKLKSSIIIYAYLMAQLVFDDLEVDYHILTQEELLESDQKQILEDIDNSTVDNDDASVDSKKSIDCRKELVEYLEFASILLERLPEFDNNQLNSYKSNIRQVLCYISSKLLLRK